MTFNKLVKIVTENADKDAPASETALLDGISILLKDEFFGRQFHKIFNKFKEGVGDYKTIPGFTTFSKGVKNLNRLEKTRDSYELKLEELQSELLENNRIINRNNLSPSEKNDMELNIAVLSKKIQVLRSQKRREKNKSRKIDFDDKIEQLEASKVSKTEKYKHAMLSPTQIERVKVAVFDITKRIKVQTDRLLKINHKIDDIYAKINEISAINLEIDKTALESVTELVAFTASKLLRECETNPTHKLADSIATLSSFTDNASTDNPLSNYISEFSDIDPILSTNPSELTFMKIKSIMTDAKTHAVTTPRKKTTDPTDNTFDKFAESILKSSAYDADDFKLNTMEVLSLINYPK